MSTDVARCGVQIGVMQSVDSRSMCKFTILQDRTLSSYVEALFGGQARKASSADMQTPYNFFECTLLGHCRHRL